MLVCIAKDCALCQYGPLGQWKPYVIVSTIWKLSRLSRENEQMSSNCIGRIVHGKDEASVSVEQNFSAKSPRFTLHRAAYRALHIAAVWLFVSNLIQLDRRFSAILYRISIWSILDSSMWSKWSLRSFHFSSFCAKSFSSAKVGQPSLTLSAKLIFKMKVIL